MVAAAEQQRYEDGLGGAESGERVREQGLVQLDVAQVHGQVGAQCADAVGERADGAQGARVAAAVADEDERGRGGATAAVERDEAELAAELAGDPVHELRRTVEVGASGRPGALRGLVVAERGDDVMYRS